MKMWSKQEEWQQYAACGESDDHTLPPERKRSPDPLDDESQLPVADTARVKSICGSCRVRPECIRWATDPAKPEQSVWVAGKWIPDNKRSARKVRAELALTIPAELEARGEDI